MSPDVPSTPGPSPTEGRGGARLAASDEAGAAVVDSFPLPPSVGEGGDGLSQNSSANASVTNSDASAGTSQTPVQSMPVGEAWNSTTRPANQLPTNAPTPDVITVTNPWALA